MPTFKEIAYLNKGLEIRFVSPWHQTSRQGDIERTYFFDSGIANLVRNVNKNRRALQETPFYYEKTVDDVSVEVAIQYNDTFTESVISFANCINTQEGGSHLTGFRSAPDPGDQRPYPKEQVNQGGAAQPGRRGRCGRAWPR